ncbi:MAG: succinyl-CoA--3-ketoacid-CoA transferase [Deltaproteobacteria bacterium]|nr:succinyl-CoA--3-ketoacid-CoA transferase [Deltaproteobacteria bacterium]
MKKFEGLPQEIIALRASQELKDGDYVNLGIGIPTMISNWIEGRDIFLHSEIGMIKTGPLAYDEDIDQDLINASCQPVTEVAGSIYFDISESFAMIRGGHVDVTVMGAFQVSEKGDFAGWNNPSRGLGNVGNIGGSMDLSAGSRRLIITMEHTTKNGDPKLLKELTYPATGRGNVNLIKEIYPGLTTEDIQSVTEPKLIISPDLKEIEL